MGVPPMIGRSRYPYRAGDGIAGTCSGHMKDYHINIFYSQADGGYVADIPDLTYCSAFGKTAAIALRQVQLAKTAWLKAAQAAGKRIPKPQYRPAIYQSVA